MNKKEFNKINKSISKQLMKKPSWKGYVIGLEDGKRLGGVAELEKLLKLINQKGIFPNGKIWEIEQHIEKRLAELKNNKEAKSK